MQLNLITNTPFINFVAEAMSAPYELREFLLDKYDDLEDRNFMMLLACYGLYKLETGKCKTPDAASDWLSDLVSSRGNAKPLTEVELNAFLAHAVIRKFRNGFEKA